MAFKYIIKHIRMVGNFILDGWIELTNQSTPSTPVSARLRLYASEINSNPELRYKNDAGVVRAIYQIEKFNDTSLKTISSGRLTPAENEQNIRLTGELLNNPDDLAGIVAGKDGDVLLLRQFDSINDITIKHNGTEEGTVANRIRLPLGQDILLALREDYVFLIYAGNNSRWNLIATNVPLFDDATSDPLPIGTVADGTEGSAARKDHVHATPDPLTFAGDVFIPDTKGLVIGHTAQVDFGATPELQVLGTEVSDSSAGFATFNVVASTAPDFRFLKSRGTTLGSNVLVVDGDRLGRIRFQGADGNDFNTTAAEFQVEVDGTASLNNVFGRFVWRTRSSGGLNEKMSLDAEGELRVITEHVVHTASENDDHALEIDLDAAGFGDVKALDVNYITGAIAAGEDEAIILVDLNEIDATGGNVFGLEVVSTEGSATVHGMGVGALIGPVHQDSGTFVNPTTGTDNTESTDVAAMIDGNVGTTTDIFENNSEYILIGATPAFTEIEFILTTGASGAGIKPTFLYSTSGTHQFTEFSPIDGTNGFKNTGVIIWDASDLTGHVADDVTGTFDIKIIRTRVSLTTTPTLGFAKTAATVVFEWDKDGAVTIDQLTGRVVFLKEQANADSDVPAQGQLWVNTATPNELFFTTDAGNDREIVYEGKASHDGFSDFVSDEHIAHAGVTITAGAGLTGGGTIAATRTLDVVGASAGGLLVNANDLQLDINSCVETALATGDFLAFEDVTGGLDKKVTFANLEALISHDNIADVSTSDHHTKYTDAEAITAVEGEATLVLSGLVTHGGNVVSDTDSTDDLGTTSVRWANLFVDDITITNDVTCSGDMAIGTDLGTSSLKVGASDPFVLQLLSTVGGATGVFVTMTHSSSTPADLDDLSILSSQANDSGGTNRKVCQTRMRWVDVTSTEMDSQMRFETMDNVNAGNANTTSFLTPGGVWTDASRADRKTYEGSRLEIWGKNGITERLRNLFVSRYHSALVPAHKLSNTERHISPTAEDLWDTFGVGINPHTHPDDIGIAPKDLAGIALIAIQELDKRVQTLESRGRP